MIDGAIWPAAIGGDDTLPWVQRDDDSDLFADDDDAAFAVADEVGGVVMWAILPSQIADARSEGANPDDYIRPFVLPFPMNENEATDTSGKLRQVDWQGQVKERFGTRKAGYDEVAGINRSED